MKTFFEFITENEIAKAEVFKRNAKLGIKPPNEFMARFPEYETGNPNQLNFPTNSTNNKSDKKTETKVGSLSVPQSGYPAAKPKDNTKNVAAWKNASRFPGEGPSILVTGKIRRIVGKDEIEDRTKYLEKSVPRYFDSPEKLKKDAEQTWKIKAREPKSSPIEKQYSGGSVGDRIDISSPKETTKSYISRRKKDTDKYYLPDKNKKGKIQDFDMVAALGYDSAKDPKTGLPDVKQERDPKLWGSYAPWSGRLQVRKEPFRGKSTTTHEYGHRGATIYKEKLPKGPKKLTSNDTYDTEEMRQREMDARHNNADLASKKDAEKWWDKLYKGEQPSYLRGKPMTAPLGDRDRISIERQNDRMIDFARGKLSKKYFKGGREPHTDDDLKRSALSSILPYANKNLTTKANSDAGSPKALNFRKTSPTSRKMDVDTRQKEVSNYGHYAIRKRVYDRNFNNKTRAGFPDSDAGNPNQLNYPKPKR